MFPYRNPRNGFSEMAKALQLFCCLPIAVGGMIHAFSEDIIANRIQIAIAGI